MNESPKYRVWRVRKRRESNEIEGNQSIPPLTGDELLLPSHPGFKAAAAERGEIDRK